MAFSGTLVRYLLRAEGCGLENVVGAALRGLRMGSCSWGGYESSFKVFMEGMDCLTGLKEGIGGSGGGLF